MAKAQMQAFRAAQAKWTDQATKPMTPWDW
jgi:hypothetical protein